MKQGNINVDYDYLCKILVVGASGIGKSSLLLSFNKEPFSDSHLATIGVDFCITNRELKNGKVAKVQIWDTAGQTRFRSIIESFYRRTHGVCLCFDLTNESTFEELPEWIASIRTLAPENTPILLVGNKMDLKHKREVKKAEAEMVVSKYGLCGYVETSAKMAENVEKAFHCMIDEIVQTENYISTEQQRLKEYEEGNIVDPDYFHRRQNQTSRSSLWSLLCGLGGR